MHFFVAKLQKNETARRLLIIRELEQKIFNFWSESLFIRSSFLKVFDYFLGEAFVFMGKTMIDGGAPPPIASREDGAVPDVESKGL